MAVTEFQLLLSRLPDVELLLVPIARYLSGCQCQLFVNWVLGTHLINYS